MSATSTIGFFFYHCQIPLPNSAAKFRRSIQKCHPQRANSATQQQKHHKNSPPNPKNATQKANFTTKKPNFISIYTKSD
ncbi:hypothetical protein [Campylobacter lanienae]|uniref:hypothetical protein n=1 Tax=Campylobacter lanienae TaxID=75658 RepID=UPI000BB40647|nr:hypothetical protein [Campylobacter lanienae]